MDLIFEGTFKKILDEYFIVFILTASSLVAIGVSYCFVRVGSGNFIRTRVWNFFAGSQDFKDEATSSLWSEVVDVENVRFKTGIDFRSRKEIDSFWKWLNKYDIPIYEARKVSRFFNVRNNYFIAYDFIGKSNRRLFATLIAAIILVAISLFYSSIRNNAYLTIKISGFSFIYKGEYIEAYDKKIDFNFCESFNKNSYDYLKSQNIKVMCDLIFSDKKNDYYISVIEKQRILFLIILFVNIFLIA